jgi:hypothetical protein
MKMDKIKIKNSWESLTYGDYMQLVQIGEANIPENYKTTHLLSILTGESVEDLESLQITTFMKLLPHLQFLNEKPKDIEHKNEYEVNGRKYIVQADVDKICTAQFLDYSSYIKEKYDTSGPNTVKLASCFLVPEGHKYGDGYDINQVWNDINDMSFLDVKALAFFLQLQYAAYILISNDCIDRQMKKMGVPKKKRRESITHLNSMARSLLS